MFGSAGKPTILPPVNGTPAFEVVELSSDNPVLYQDQSTRLDLTIANTGDGIAQKVVVEVYDTVPSEDTKDLVTTLNLGAFTPGMEKTKFIDWSPESTGIHYLSLEINSTQLYEPTSEETTEITLYSSSFPVTPTATEEYWGPFEEYPSIITSTESYRFREGPLTIFVRDDLVIESGATLEFGDSVTVIMDNSYRGEYSIEVQPDAEFIIDSPSKDTFISPPMASPDNSYPLSNSGTLAFSGANIMNIYGNKADLTQQGGIQNMPGSSCTLNNCKLIDADTHSISTTGDAQVQIKGTETIIGSEVDPGVNDVLNGHGIYVSESGPTIEDVTVQFHKMDGIHAENSRMGGPITSSNIDLFGSDIFDKIIPSTDRSIKSYDPIVTIGNSIHSFWISEEGTIMYLDGRIDYGGVHLMHSKSDDEGLTWSPPAKILSNYAIPNLIPLFSPSSVDISSDGDNIGIVYANPLGGGAQYFIKYSNDNGNSWEETNISYFGHGVMEGRASIDWQGSTAYMVFQTRSNPVARYIGIAYETFESGTVSQVEELFETEGRGIPKIAVDEDDVHIIFGDPELNHEFTYLRNIDEAGWESSFIASYNLNGIGFDKGTFDLSAEKGFVSLVWQSYDEVNHVYDIFSKTSRDSGANWNNNIQLSSNVGFSLNPKCSIDSDSKTHVIWQNNEFADFNLKYSCIDVLGNILIDEYDLTAPGTVKSTNPTFDFDDSDNVFIMWDDTRVGASKIYTKWAAHQLLISNSDITLNDNGLTIDNSNVMITGSKINNNDYGVIATNSSAPLIKDNLIDGNNVSISSINSSPVLEGNYITNCTYGFYSDNDVSFDVRQNTFVDNEYGIYANNSEGDRGTINTFSDGSTDKSFYLERGDDALTSIMVPDNSVITKASFEVAYQDYIPSINYQQNASYRGLNTTYYYDVLLNNSLSYNVPIGWDVEYLAIYIENITVDGIETTLGDMNISAEHNATTIQFENRSNSAIFWNNLIDMSSSPLDFDISTTTENVMINLSFKVLLTKTIPVTWQDIADGYDALIPLTSPENFNLTNPRLIIDMPNMNYGELNSYIDETTQQMTNIFTHETGEYVVFNMSENSIIGTIWAPEDENTSMNIQMVFFSNYTSICIGGDMENATTYDLAHVTQIDIADYLNKFILENGCNNVPVIVSVPNTGLITLSDLTILSNSNLTFVNANQFTNNSVGIYITNSETCIFDNTMANNTEGIKIESSSPYIYSNYINKSDFGINVLNSKGDIFWNEISFSQIGININNTVNSSLPISIEENVIYKNDMGINAKSEYSNGISSLGLDESIYDIFSITNSIEEINIENIASSLESETISYSYKNNTTLPKFSTYYNEIYLQSEGTVLVFDFPTSVSEINHRCYVTNNSIIVAFSHNYSVPFNGLFQDSSSHRSNKLSTTDLLNVTITDLFTRSGTGEPDKSIFTSPLIKERGYLLQSATNEYGSNEGSSTSWTEFEIPPDNSVVCAWLRGNALVDGTLYPDFSTEWIGEYNQSVLSYSLDSSLRVTTRDLQQYNTAGGASLSIITEGSISPTETHSYQELNLDLKDEVFITYLYGINQYASELTTKIYDNQINTNNISLKCDKMFIDVNGNDISGNNYALFIDNSTGLLNKNCIYSDMGDEVYSINYTNIEIIDSTINTNKLIADSSSLINIYQHTKISTFNEIGTPKEMVCVSIESDSNDAIFNSTTTYNGETETHLLSVFNSSIGIIPENITAIDSNSSYAAPIKIVLSPEIFEHTIYIGIDSDNDGLTDGEEIFVYLTEPMTNDTDQDKLLDGLEVGLSYPHTNLTNLMLFKADNDPLTRTMPLEVDTDGDGLKDGEEDINQNGKIDSYESIPTNPDSDGDLILDGLEIGWFMDSDDDGDINAMDLDSDDDGLPDNVEDANLNGQIDNCEPSPINQDSNANGIQDGNEMDLIELLLVNISGPDKYCVYVHGNRFPQTEGIYYDSDVQINDILSVGYIQNNIYIEIFNDTETFISEFFVSSLGNDNINCSNSNISLNIQSKRFPYPLTLDDSDGDGASDLREAIYYSTRIANFTSYDGDGDGLFGIYDPDSDNDGLSDGEEIDSASYYGTYDVPDINLYPNQEWAPYLFKGGPGEYKVYFKEESNVSDCVAFIVEDYVFLHDIVSMSSDGTIVSYNQNVSGNVIGNRMEYNNVMTQSDVKYEVYPDFLKETYILKNSVPLYGDQSLSFNEAIVYDSTNVSVWADGAIKSSSFETSGAIMFKSGAQTIMSLEPAYAIDSSSNIVSCAFNVDMILDTLMISTVVPGSFMSVATYPIIIDPTISIMDTEMWPFDTVQSWYPDVWGTFGDQWPYGICMADVNNDNYEDLITVIRYLDGAVWESYVGVHLSNSEGIDTSELWSYSFSSDEWWQCTYGDGPIEMIDIDNDGDKDLILADSLESGGNWYSSIKIFENKINEGGTFTYAWYDGVPGPFFDMSFGDYDNDGYIDMALANGYGLRVYANTESGDAADSYIPDTYTWSVGAQFDSYSAQSVEWGDVDEDGDLDIVTDWHVHENVGGTLAFSWIWTNPEPPSSFPATFSLADINNDGYLDYCGQSEIHLSSNEPFTQKSYIRDYSFINPVLVDVDNDTDIDIISRANQYSDMKYYPNVGGEISSNGIWTSWSYMSAIESGDYDKDNDLDVVVINENWRKIEIFENQYSDISNQIYPTNLTAHNETESSVTLTWNENNPAVFDHYGIFYSRVENMTLYGEYPAFTIPFIGTTTFTVNKLEPNTTYYFAVVAFGDYDIPGIAGYANATTLPVYDPLPPIAIITQGGWDENTTLLDGSTSYDPNWWNGGIVSYEWKIYEKYCADLNGTLLPEDKLPDYSAIGENSEYLSLTVYCEGYFTFILEVTNTCGLVGYTSILVKRTFINEETEGTTDPMDSDSDGDGLTDGEEDVLGTDKNDADSDGDGLTDWEEVYVWPTSPKWWDSEILTGGNDLIDDFSDPQQLINNLPFEIDSIKASGESLDWREAVWIELSAFNYDNIDVYVHDFQFIMGSYNPVVHINKYETGDWYISWDLPEDWWESYHHQRMLSYIITMQDSITGFKIDYQLFFVELTVRPIITQCLVDMALLSSVMAVTVTAGAAEPLALEMAIEISGHLIAEELGHTAYEMTLENEFGETVTHIAEVSFSSATEIFTDSQGNYLYLKEGFHETTSYNGSSYTRGFGRQYIEATNPISSELITEIIQNGSINYNHEDGGFHRMYVYLTDTEIYNIIVGIGITGVNDNVILRVEVITYGP